MIEDSSKVRECARDKGDLVETCSFGCSEIACCENSQHGIQPYNCLLQTEKVLGSIANLGAPCPGCGLENL